MIPLGENTAILSQVQENDEKNRGFPLTLFRTAPQLTAVCVSSPIHSTPSPGLRRKHSSCQKRISSIPSMCREKRLQEVKELFKPEPQKDLRIDRESKTILGMPPRQISQNCLIDMISRKETNSLLETKKDLSPEFMSSDNNHGDSQTPSPFESKNHPKVKNKTSLSRTSKASHKSKSRKLLKSRTFYKRKNNTKSYGKVPSVFQRLTSGTFKKVNNNQETSNQESPSLKKDTTTSIAINCNKQDCVTLLEIRQLHATYNSKQNTKPKTFLLLPKVPKLTNDNKKCSPRITVKQESQNTKIITCKSSTVNSQRQRQRQKSLDFKSKENIVSCQKIYLSEMQSKAIDGIPRAPPGTPSPDQLKIVEYIPSLMDVKSQRAVKSKLEKIAHKIRIKEQQRKEFSVKQDQKKIKESLLQLKQRQRLEIYALNKVMTGLENENFKKFMDKNETVCLGV